MGLRLKGKNKYWYRMYHYVCPECGSERIIRTRERFLPKPNEKQTQHIRIESYDYCKEIVKM